MIWDGTKVDHPVEGQPADHWLGHADGHSRATRVRSSWTSVGGALWQSTSSPSGPVWERTGSIAGPQGPAGQILDVTSDTMPPYLIDPTDPHLGYHTATNQNPDLTGTPEQRFINFHIPDGIPAVFAQDADSP